MASNLAKEITDYLSSQSPTTDIRSISFICHSLGGLIVRTALSLPTLLPIKSKLHTIVTFGTPHLGYFLAKSWQTTLLMRLALSVGKATAFQQLMLQDNSDPRQCFLYKLSQQPGRYTTITILPSFLLYHPVYFRHSC
jgi:triacylglycerol esterase/lipase EstA (alpha/beta hydrolase family)